MCVVLNVFYVCFNSDINIFWIWDKIMKINWWKYVLYIIVIFIDVYIYICIFIDIKFGYKEVNWVVIYVILINIV